MKKAAFAAAVAAALVLVLAGPSQAYIIDRIAAVVNGKVITVGEVERAARAEALRRGITGGEKYGELRDEALQALIDRTLLLEEARRFNLVEVDDEEVEKALEYVRATFPSQAEFEKALMEDEMSEEDLKAQLREQILAAKYVDRRVKFFVRVTIDDQRNYYEENREKFGDRSFSEVHDEIYDLLLEMETNDKLDEYLRKLREKSVISIKVPHRQGGGGLKEKALD